MQQATREAMEVAVQEAQEIGHRGARPGEAASNRGKQTRHDRHRLDALHRRIFTLLSPRIHHLTGRYGLTDMEDDARQACAIAIHRAIGSYSPAKASFSTHVTWAMRGELQSLRHRVRLDQRDSAKAAGVSTVSLEGLAGADGEAVFEIVDDASLHNVERRASEMSTQRVMGRLMDRIGSPEEERVIVMDTLFERGAQEALPRKERDRRRQIVRRTFRNCAKVAVG